MRRREEKHDYVIKAVGNPGDEQQYYDKVITSLFKQVFGLSLKTRFLDKRKTYGFQISSKQLVTYLIEYVGLPESPKYEHMRIPSPFKKDEILLAAFVRGVFDTDGCISFKRRHKENPYYPVLSIRSKSASFIRELQGALRTLGLEAPSVLDYKLKDDRMENGFCLTSSLALSGHANLAAWLSIIGSWHPKHGEKILTYGREESRRRVRAAICVAGAQPVCTLTQGWPMAE